MSCRWTSSCTQERCNYSPYCTSYTPKINFRCFPPLPDGHTLSLNLLFTVYPMQSAGAVYLKPPFGCPCSVDCTPARCPKVVLRYWWSGVSPLGCEPGSNAPPARSQHSHRFMDTIQKPTMTLSWNVEIKKWNVVWKKLQRRVGAQSSLTCASIISLAEILWFALVCDVVWID
jgi:hypothetical protein